MNNQEHAARIVRSMITVENPTHCQDIVQALADDGLLMPDLPTDVPVNGDNYDDIYTTGRMVYACIGTGYELDYEELRPDEAIEHALMLLAAAKLAEEQE